MNDWLADRARATPGLTAMVNATSGNQWDYATLDETVDEMAGRLAALGVEPGDHVGAVLGTCAEHVCLVHATMRLGAVLVPLSPEFTAPEVGDRIDRADVTTVICSDETETGVRTAVGRERVGDEVTVVTIDDPAADGVSALSETTRVDVDPPDWDRGDSQLILFTSGTTGTPKAVVLTMGNLLASAVASAFRLGVTPGDSWLVPLSLHHMGGIAPVLRSTLYGSTVVVRDEFDPGGTVDDIVEFDVTGVSLVPTMLRRMLDARGTLPDSLRFVLVGGAPTPPDLVERCRNFRVPVCPTWGMTETASQIATARPEEAFENLQTVGQPLLWTQVTVVDGDGQPVEPGESGELVVDGPTVTPGYYGDEARTAEAFGEHGLHTGDVGYRDEVGRVYVLNRLDDRIVTGGENVDPGEVAGVLEAHPDIDAATVVGLPEEEWGQRVAALIVPATDHPALADLESFCRERLAGFKLPRTVGIEEDLPRTVSGTVDRVAVRDRLRDGPVEALGDLTDLVAEPVEPAENHHVSARDAGSNADVGDAEEADAEPGAGEDIAADETPTDAGDDQAGDDQTASDQAGGDQAASDGTPDEAVGDPSDGDEPAADSIGEEPVADVADDDSREEVDLGLQGGPEEGPADAHGDRNAADDGDRDDPDSVDEEHPEADGGTDESDGADGSETVGDDAGPLEEAPDEAGGE